MEQIQAIPAVYLQIPNSLCPGAWLLFYATKFGILKEMGIPDHFTCPMRNVYVLQEEPYMEQQIGSKLGNEYIKAVYCYPVYLTYMQNTSCECQAEWSKS